MTRRLAFPTSGVRRIVVVLWLASALAGCSLRGTGPSTTIDPGNSIPPTQAAVEADEAMRVVPDGYLDCGTTSLTSGWPTTTMYVGEISAVCILDAANAGVPAQYSYTSRDNAGGVTGTILRVDGVEMIVELDYRVDDEGNPTTTELTCTSLTGDDHEPPSCGDAS